MILMKRPGVVGEVFPKWMEPIRRRTVISRRPRERAGRLVKAHSHGHPPESYELRSAAVLQRSSRATAC
jgi:hypothetical protein